MINTASNLRPETLLSLGHRSKLPTILQTEAAECGLACLAMVAGYFGYDTDLISVRHKFAVSAHGATLKQIMDIAAKMHMSSRALRLEVEQMDQLQLPCILHWEMKHFVVLRKVTKKKLVIHDPAIGECHLTFKEASQSFTGVALELIPTPEFKKSKAKRSLGFTHFWSRIRGLRRSMFTLLLLSLFLQLFAIVSPYYMQTVVDDVILRADLNLLTVLALGFGLLLLIEAGTLALRQFVVLNLSTKLGIQMAANVFHHLIRLPMSYFAKRHMGDVVSRFGSLSQIRELLTVGLIEVMIDGIMALITLVVMFIYSPKLTAIVMAVVGLYALLRYLLYRPLRLLNEEQIVASAKENSHFMESVRAIQTVKLFEQESERQSQWQNRLADAMNKGIRISRWEIGFSSASQLLFGLENIIIVYFAADAVMGNLMSVGMLFAFISYKVRFIGAMDKLIAKWIEFRMLDLHFDRLADIVFTPTDDMNASEHPSLSLNENSQQAQQIQGKISLQNLSFAYSPADAPTFSQVNLDISPGETVAIIGPSGGGKSTLLKCMMGLLKPTSGEIYIDDQPLKQVSRFRQQIAAVMQDDQLLSGTIMENIACFASEVSLERIAFSAHAASIHEEITQTSMQYNTLVGDMGTNLSGGQKQRIILARALYKKPRILFMDEATSHLDIHNEKDINRHIKNLSITRIIVAHRQETIRCADRIFQLVMGRLEEVTDQVKADNSTKT